MKKESKFNFGGFREFSTESYDQKAIKNFSDEAYSRLVAGEYKSLNVEFFRGIVRFTYEFTNPTIVLNKDNESHNTG